MSRATISLSTRDARELRDFLRPGCEGHASVYQAERWVAALDAALKPKKGVTAARKQARAKVELRREKFSKVRRAVEKRASGLCEACGAAFSDVDPGECDHAFGGANRRSLESVEGCWLIHGRSCHRLKTANDPSALHWLCLFREHATRYGYFAMAREAEKRIDATYLLAAASKCEVAP